MTHRNTISALCHWNIFPLITFNFRIQKGDIEPQKYKTMSWSPGKLNFELILSHLCVDMYLVYSKTDQFINTRQYFLTRLEIVQILSYIHLTLPPVSATQEIYLRFQTSAQLSINFPLDNLFQRLQEVKAHQHRIWKQTLPVHSQHKVLLRKDKKGGGSLCTLKLSCCCTPVTTGFPWAMELPKWQGE